MKPNNKDSDMVLPTATCRACKVVGEAVWGRVGYLCPACHAWWSKIRPSAQTKNTSGVCGVDQDRKDEE